MQTLIFPAINLIILLAIVVYYTKKPFVGFMQQRHHDVYHGLNKSKVQAALAQAKRAEVEAKLVNLDSEKSKIAHEWDARKSEQIKELAQGATRVIEQMKTEIEQNKKALEFSIRTDVLQEFRSQVLAQAETKIKSALTPEVHARLNQSFIQDVAQGVNTR